MNNQLAGDIFATLEDTLAEIRRASLLEAERLNQNIQEAFHDAFFDILFEEEEE